MFQRFINLFLLIIFFFSCPAFSEQLNIKVQHAKLENGLDVYVVPNHRIPAVLHAVVYKIGGMDDPVGKAGLAHYFEHLMFKTTGKFKNIESTLGSIGARFNAFTTKEYTCYYELVATQNLQLAMEIEADRMSSFNVDQDKIEKEKNIVLEERKMRFDNNPYSLIWEEMNNAFYRTGYGRPVVGWEEDINTFNRESIEKFHDSYYHPGNAMLLVVGDVEFDEVLKLANAKYGAIESKPVVRSYPNQEPAHNANIELTVASTQVKEPMLYFRYKVPMSKSTKDVLTTNLAVNLLGREKSSRLYKHLVLDKEVAVSVHSYYHGLTFSNGFVDIGVIPKSGVTLDVIEKELEQSINDFLHEKMTNEELNSAKYKYKVAQFDALSNLESIAFFYVSHLALNIPLEEIDISYSQVDDISLEDVNDKIHTIFSATKLIGRLLPKGDISNENQ
ncbi:MAG: pitrilysin family protein [Wolbachia endosymbiont of Tyrophagus putrescentiae]|nr:pitrilysin family protein [Wolbachia endosymbiont of Tyrophagus putrescentiae]